MATQRASTEDEILDEVPSPARTTRTTPKDHLPAVTKSQWLWTSAKGDHYVLPRMDSFDSGLIRRNRRRDDLDFLYTVLEEVLPDTELTRLDRLKVAEVNEMFALWLKETGAKLGE